MKIDVITRQTRRVRRKKISRIGRRRKDQENNVITENNTDHTVKGRIKNQALILLDSPSYPSGFCWAEAGEQ